MNEDHKFSFSSMLERVSNNVDLEHTRLDLDDFEKKLAYLNGDITECPVFTPLYEYNLDEQTMKPLLVTPLFK
jgi:hypothetical protein